MKKNYNLKDDEINSIKPYLEELIFENLPLYVLKNKKIDFNKKCIKLRTTKIYDSKLYSSNSMITYNLSWNECIGIFKGEIKKISSDSVKII